MIAAAGVVATGVEGSSTGVCFENNVLEDTYAKLGSYTVSVTATDGSGDTVSNTVSGVETAGSAYTAADKAELAATPTASPVAAKGLVETGVGGEAYHDWGKNPWVETSKDHLSTFAADVDTASYTIMRRKLEEGTLPPPASVRVEEYVNYFRYSFPAPTGSTPFAVVMDAAPSPLQAGRDIVRVGVATKAISQGERKPALKLMETELKDDPRTSVLRVALSFSESSEAGAAEFEKLLFSARNPKEK